MTNHHASLSHLSDDEILAEVRRSVTAERRATARLIASLAELDQRRLYLAAGSSSLFTYCTQVLHLSEHAAYLRIEAARAARRFPLVVEQLADGAVHLTAIGMLSPYLTAENHREVLDAARHKSKREVEHLVARLRPRPDVPASVRKLPGSTASTAAATSTNPTPAPTRTPPAAGPLSTTPSERARPAHRTMTVNPLAPERYKLQCTLSRDTYQKLRRAQDLLRHSVSTGDPAEILDRALTLLVASLEKKKLAATDRPRPTRAAAKRSRHIPAGIRRAVWARDGGRCAFVGTEGRCTETGFLEFHHVVPYAAGGVAVVDNLQLRCRAHNVFEADRDFGWWFVRETRLAFS